MPTVVDSEPVAHVVISIMATKRVVRLRRCFIELPYQVENALGQEEIERAVLPGDEAVYGAGDIIRELAPDSPPLSSLPGSLFLPL